MSTIEEVQALLVETLDSASEGLDIYPTTLFLSEEGIVTHISIVTTLRMQAAPQDILKASGDLFSSKAGETATEFSLSMEIQSYHSKTPDFAEAVRSQDFITTRMLITVDIHETSYLMKRMPDGDWFQVPGDHLVGEVGTFIHNLTEMVRPLLKKAPA